MRCGTPLEGAAAHAGEPAKRSAFAAAPNERAAVPRVVSTLFPQLPRASMRGFQITLMAGAALVAALAALRLFPLAVVGAAVLVPLLTIVYCYAVDVYERAPWFAIAFTVVWGIAAGGGVALLARAVAPTGAELVHRTSTSHVVTGGVLLPLLGFVLALAGPLVLLPYRRYNDVLDGATFGAVTAATLAGAQAIVYGTHMFDHGLRPLGAVWPWVVRILASALAQPILVMAAVGFAAAALWLRFRAQPAERKALGLLGHPLVAVPLAAILVVAGAVTEPITSGGLWLVILAALAFAALLLLRRAIHVGLMQEAAEHAGGDSFTCANCGAETQPAAFCSNCGVALRALPKPREPDTPQGGSHGRATRRGAIAAFGAVLLFLVGASAAVGALVEPNAPEPLCRPYEPCGHPPVAASPLVNGKIWRSPRRGFAAEYSGDRMRIDGQTPDSVTLTYTDAPATLTIRGRSGVSRDLLADEVGSLGGSFLAFTRDRTPEDAVLGPNVGLRPGFGGAYSGTRSSPTGLGEQDSVGVMAAGHQGLAIVATVTTRASDPDEKGYIYALADQVIKSVAWPSDLSGPGAGAFFHKHAQRPPPAPPAATARRRGTLTPGARVHFSLVLRARHAQALRRYLSDLQDPHSGDYHRYLDARGFGARFGIADGDLDALRRSLARAGVKMSRPLPQRTEVDAEASAVAVERLFGVRLAAYVDPHRRVFHAPVGRPRIPAAIAVRVTAVAGLDTRPRSRPAAVPAGGLTPRGSVLAYDMQPLHARGISGQGQSVAIVSFATYADEDPQAFDRRYGIHGPLVDRIRLPGGPAGSGHDEQGEANLDIDVIRGVAPQARILFFEAPRNATYGQVINAINADGRAKVASISWGQCDPDMPPGDRAADKRAFDAAVAAGISIFVASGDSGAYTCQAGRPADHRLSASWPSSSSSVISVGGTRLYVGSTGGYVREYSWEGALSQQGGGGGLASVDRRPAWQARALGVQNQYSTGRRQLPDVSANADPDTGFATISGGMTQQVGGTSASTPLWAGAAVLMQQYAQKQGVASLGFLAPELYRVASTPQRYPPFHDVTRGGNRFYESTRGWDYATGLGSPDVYNLARDLVDDLRSRRH